MNTNGGFKNFWHYNKGKIIASVFFIAFIVFAVTQCNMTPKTNFSILCATEAPNGNGEILKQKLSENIDFSKTDEGNQELYYEHINIPKTIDEQSQVGTFESIHTRMINGDCSLLLFDKETVYYYQDQKEVFVDLTPYADKYNIPDEKRYINAEGIVCAIGVESNEFLKSCSLKTEDMYVAIRIPQDGDTPKYTNAKASLEYIISNQ